MFDSERSGGKYINIRILTSTHRQMLDLAGADFPLEQYLENIINQIATGTSIENLKQTTSIMQAPLKEITDKLVVLADSMQQLTRMTLENRSAIESIRAMLTTLPPGRIDNQGTLYSSPDRSGEPPPSAGGNPRYTPRFPDNQAPPGSSPTNISYDATGSEDTGILEAKMKKYEEENPW